MNEKRKARIAIVVSHPIQHFCPQYVSFSKMEGFEVKLFFASMLGYRKYVDKNFGQEIVWNNLRIEEFDHVFLNGEQILLSSKEIDAPTLNEELDKFKPDALISYGFFQKVQRRGHKWANKNNVPIAYINDSENRQHRPLIKRFVKFFYLRWYFTRINYFFTVGNANEDYYRHYGVPEKKFIRMHYPIDVDVYKEAFNNKDEIRNTIREKYNVPKDDFVMCVVGKLVPWKNQDHLIDLLLNLEKKGKKAHVFILGSGTMLDAWKDKAAKLLTENKAHFTGFIDPLNLPEFYAASDLYVHPASIEPHSLAISEAIYMGCPLVISDKCGSYGEDDDLQEGKNGYVYQFGNIEQLTEKVSKLMDDKVLRKLFSEYSRQISIKFQARAHKECIIDLKEKI
jgi:glycosyltransferase involved in cell wall biosynthesis